MDPPFRKQLSRPLFAIANQNKATQSLPLQHNTTDRFIHLHCSFLRCRILHLPLPVRSQASLTRRAMTLSPSRASRPTRTPARPLSGVNRKPRVLEAVRMVDLQGPAAREIRERSDWHFDLNMEHKWESQWLLPNVCLELHNEERRQGSWSTLSMLR